MSWIRAGTAVRTAIDINLHRIALLKHAREGLPVWLVRSFIRTWLMSFVVDRTLSAQMGKPSSMRGESSVRQYLELISTGEQKPTADDIRVAALAVGSVTAGKWADTDATISNGHRSLPGEWMPFARMRLTTRRLKGEARTMTIPIWSTYSRNNFACGACNQRKLPEMSWNRGRTTDLYNQWSAIYGYIIATLV